MANITKPSLNLKIEEIQENIITTALESTYQATIMQKNITM